MTEAPGELATADCRELQYVTYNECIDSSGEDDDREDGDREDEDREG